MPRLVPFLLSAGLPVVAAAWLVASSPRPTPGAAEPAPNPTSRTPQLQGVASCASMACHHANGPRGSWRSEYTTWATYDAHARACTVLFDKRSLTIEKNLKGLANLKDAHPEQDRLCLNCHVQPRLEETARNERFNLIDGVGCEACHGPAEKWIGRHYTDEWRGKTAEEKARLGMTNTKDLRVRAEACVTCHVGSAGGEVNHDLLAAGHPRLRFEFGAYLANYPKHWSERKDKDGRPDFEARAWLIGQLVSARAAVDLLEDRARKPEKPWPEFAEYGCFACHHNLTSPSPWQENWLKQGRAGKPPVGSLPWGTWYAAALPALAAGEAGVDLKALKDLEESMSPRAPDRKEISGHCRRVSRLLTEWLGRVGERAVSEREMADLLVRLADERAVAESNWDGATQVYLGLAAAFQGLGDVQPRFRQQANLRGAIKDLSHELDSAFPREPGANYESPRDFKPAAFRTRLEAVREQLKQLTPK